MDKKIIDTIVWWIPFKKTRNAVRSLLINLTESKPILTKEDITLVLESKNNSAAPIETANQIIVPHLEISITTKCTLKCINCNNLNTHYYMSEYNTPPVDTDMNSIIDNVNRFLTNVDKVIQFRIMGGEPFIHKELYRLIELAKANPKIVTIRIITNGTLIPKDQNLLSLKNNDRTLVKISNYGKLSSKINELKSYLLSENINTDEVDFKNEKWIDAGDISCRNRTTEEIIDVYNLCGFRHCKHMLNGKIYGCPRIAHAHNLNLYKPQDNEFIDLESLGNDTKAKLYNFFILGPKYYNFCNYCDGLSKYSKKIEAAVQLIE